MNRRNTVVVLLLGAAVWLGWLTADLVTKREVSTPRVPVQPEARTQMPSDMQASIEVAAEEIARLAMRTTPPVAAVVMQQGEQDGRDRSAGDWPGAYRRTDFPLFEHLLTSLGRWDAALLVRHVQLNVWDQPMSDAQVEQIRSLVVSLNQALTPAAKAYAGVRWDEMVALVDAGAIPEEKVATPSPAVLKVIARQKIASGEMAGMSLEEAVTKLVESQPLSLSSNSIVRKGRVYRASNFATLPTTDAAFGGLRFLVFDAASQLGSWFLLHGYTDMQHIASVLREGESLSRLDVERMGPGIR